MPGHVPGRSRGRVVRDRLVRLILRGIIACSAAATMAASSGVRPAALCLAQHEVAGSGLVKGLDAGRDARDHGRAGAVPPQVIADAVHAGRALAPAVQYPDDHGRGRAAVGQALGQAAESVRTGHAARVPDRVPVGGHGIARMGPIMALARALGTCPAGKGTRLSAHGGRCVPPSLELARGPVTGVMFGP